jgi:hypothetical protein
MRILMTKRKQNNDHLRGLLENKLLNILQHQLLPWPWVQLRYKLKDHLWYQFKDQLRAKLISELKDCYCG